MLLHENAFGLTGDRKKSIFSTELIKPKVFTLREELCLWNGDVLRKIIPCAKACTCFVDQEDIGFFTMASSEIWNSLSLGLVDASFCCFRSITESLCVLPPPLLKPSTSACYLTTGVERKCVDLEKNTYIPEPPLNAFFQGISKYPWNLL